LILATARKSQCLFGSNFEIASKLHAACIFVFRGAPSRKQTDLTNKAPGNLRGREQKAPNALCYRSIRLIADFALPAVADPSPLRVGGCTVIRLNHPHWYLDFRIARFCPQSAILVSAKIILEISLRYFAVRIPQGRGGILSLNANRLSIQLSRRRIFEAVRRNRPLALFNWHS
jgi:hypothetical protein